MTRRFHFTFIALTVLAAGLFAQKTRVVPKGKKLSYETDNPRSPGLAAHLDSVVKSYMQSPENCGLAIAICHKGRKLYYHYGETARDNGRLPDRSSVFEIGSVTNMFLGWLFAKAVAEGKIDPEEPLQKFLPENIKLKAHKGQTIRLRHLMAHTSGLPRLPVNLKIQENYDSLNPFKHYTRELLFASVTRSLPASVPGQKYDYSVMGMMLLGAVLEKVYGQDLSALVMSSLIAPLNLASTCYLPNDDQLARSCSGYDEDGKAVPAWEFGEVPAAGGYRSSAADLLELLQYQFTKEKLVVKSQEILFHAKPRPAMGWFVKRTVAGNDLYWQNGGTGGFSAFCGFIKDRETGVVVLSNSARNVDYIALALLNYLQRSSGR